MNATRSVVLVLAVLAAAARAEDPVPAGPEPTPKWPPEVAGVTWTNGPATCKVADGSGALSEVKIPEGWNFTDGDGTRTLLELMGNLVGTSESGSVYPGSPVWFAVFDFDPCGYVKDDEKESLDADAILAAKREGTAAGNEERRKRGMPTMELIGWESPPHYDEATHNLEWAVRLRTAGETTDTVNYEVRLLGRRGVMSVKLVCDPADIGAAMPEFRKLLATHAFLGGQDYGSYSSGDKVAEYGLAGLAAGGAFALAAKSGLLTKFWKLIVAAVIALGAGIKKLFGGAKPTPKRPSSS